MPKMNEFNGKEKLAILEELKTGRGSMRGIAYKYNIELSTLKDWRRRYEAYGIEGLEIRTENQSYSAELKLQDVKDYLSGRYSQNEIIRRSGSIFPDGWLSTHRNDGSFRPKYSIGLAVTREGIPIRSWAWPGLHF